ncbi:Peptide/nickel transport system substrate-binding protein [Hyphomicrobiales bacterium]|nr:Peptide/nickel transport system substrate-binding protein [Hyphomicrobiales bacterium]CAH1691104.1 Peptide/nickel transport system substrate-binding protein [Hyphomicrobiales bacterium]
MKMARIKARLLACTAVAAGLLSWGTAAAQAEICGRKGGDLVFGMEAKLSTLDQHVNAANATRNVAMNIFETLMTRDENMAPVLDLAEQLNVSDDGKTYTFKLRPGVKFHNGKPLTSADVAGSFARYKRIGIDRSALDAVDRWETPDDATFRIILKEPRATFLESISASTVPIVIVPADQSNAEPTQLKPNGTGPFELVEFVADSHVKVKRFDGYVPNKTLKGISGFAGQKEACLDTVTFRTLAEPGARTAALETGEVQIVEDVPTLSRERLSKNKDIKLVQLDYAGLNLTYPNLSQAPTDNLKVRQAILASLNMEDIMDAASDGAFSLNPSFQFPGQTYYSEAGGELYNQNNPEKAKALLKEAGYKGEKVVLLTTRDIPRAYTTALVMSEQMKAAGINAELLVLDWPTALGMSVNESKGWNFFFTTWITVTAQGGAQSLRNLADPSNVHKPVGNKSDEEFMKQFNILSSSPDLEKRKEAFAKAQARVFDQVMAIPFGAIPKIQATRANVEGYIPFFNTRVSNIWLKQ